MKLIKIFSSLLILSIFFEAVSFADIEEENFPKIAFVKNKSANVRAGDNMNFESLCVLEKHDPVKIIGKRYSWFKIILPKKAHLYIKNDYVDFDHKKGIGSVNGVRINLRAGPSTKYSILGQVSKPEQLKIAAEKDGWYEIEPPAKTAGWIHSSEITFRLEDGVK